MEIQKFIKEQKTRIEKILGDQEIRSRGIFDKMEISLQKLEMLKERSRKVRDELATFIKKSRKLNNKLATLRKKSRKSKDKLATPNIIWRNCVTKCF